MSTMTSYQYLETTGTFSFPRQCHCCGQVYRDIESYFEATQPAGLSQSGLKQSFDDADATVVEAYRNCQCGSTLLVGFTDRRQKIQANETQQYETNALTTERSIKSCRRQHDTA